ncbi:MAG: glutamate 5-kinase [Proteobacteria bacterium]|nr:glutamate 5-kinase [Pseudomonadota bacterium]
MPAEASGALLGAASERLQQARRWVVKIGSSLLTADGTGLDLDAMAAWAQALAPRLAQGDEIILVSSGAVAEGARRLGYGTRPANLEAIQAAAAVGQVGLIDAWAKVLSAEGRTVGLVLLTHDDLSDRTRYLNARGTLRTLLAHGAIPVINENDTVATEELRFGDNDTLAALVANLMAADVLVLMTDQEGLRVRDPRLDPSAPLLACAAASDPSLDAMAGPTGGALGRGGMVTKLRAARLAARSGALTAIVSGRTPKALTSLFAGAPAGTLLVPDQAPLAARKRWIAGQLQTRGTVLLDAGAARAVQAQGRSLLAVGVRGLRGSFARGEVVACEDPAGVVVARGLVNFSAEELGVIQGCATDEIPARLGYPGAQEVIHRDDLVVL